MPPQLVLEVMCGKISVLKIYYKNHIPYWRVIKRISLIGARCLLSAYFVVALNHTLLSAYHIFCGQ